MFAWRKEYGVTDPEISLLIRSLHKIEAILECKFTSGSWGDVKSDGRNRWHIIAAVDHAGQLGGR
jgi:hypothetical protein